jgi:arylsulfatase A-like enzyme
MGYRTTPGLPREVPTLATALKGLGYRTGHLGKWHLGLREGSRPQDHGFDETFGFLAGSLDYYSHIWYGGANRPVTVDGREGRGNFIHDLWENGREVWEDGRYLTELIAERAVEFVRRAAERPEPFCLYVAFNAPHFPMHAPQRYRDRFAHLGWDRQLMAAMLSAMDDAVGGLLDELERRGLRERTLVFFQSDNGPSRESRNWLDGRLDPYYGGSAGRLKGHKFSLFEGGIRVPAIMSWPARIPARQVVDTVGIAMDIFPTVLRAAGGDPSGHPLDGLDVLPVVSEGAPSPHPELYWEMGEQTAIRRGRWKLVLNGQLVEGEPPQDPVFLADLETDPGERTNLAATEPGLVRELEAKAEAWRRGIEARWAREWAPRMAGPTSYVYTP